MNQSRIVVFSITYCRVYVHGPWLVCKEEALQLARELVNSHHLLEILKECTGERLTLRIHKGHLTTEVSDVPGTAWRCWLFAGLAEEFRSSQNSLGALVLRFVSDRSQVDPIRGTKEWSGICNLPKDLFQHFGSTFLGGLANYSPAMGLTQSHQ